MTPSVFIKRLTFNDSKTFDFSPNDIIVFTGANNAGKSQVLRDILTYMNWGTPQQIIKGGVLEKNGTYENIKENSSTINGRVYYNNIELARESDWTNSKCLGGFCNAFISHLSTETRLQASNPPQSFNYLTDRPHHPIQMIAFDDKKEEELANLFYQAFGSHIIVNRGAGNLIPIHVGSKPQIEKNEDRVSISYLKKLSELSLLNNQGDGMRSFSGILLNIFISQHTISLIDEPEAFLHPPQARLLGRMLANNKPNHRQLFISTHSEDFLKGLLDANNDNIKIIRIDRVKDINNMCILDNSDIKNIWKDPILRYSNILAGLFHSKVVVCEADTDCLFYQAVMDSMHEDTNEISPDILYTHCGGKNRLKTVVKALNSLNVKTAVIADIDILKGDGDITFKETTDALGINWTSIEGKRRIVLEYIKGQRPQLSLKDVRKDIDSILDSISEEHLPTDAIEKIRRVIKLSTAWSKVKEVGKRFLAGETVKAYNELEAICSSGGLFIVPVGELERFYPEIVGHGTKWVNEVLEAVDLKNDIGMREAREFVEKIIKY